MHTGTEVMQVTGLSEEYGSSVIAQTILWDPRYSRYLVWLVLDALADNDYSFISAAIRQH